MLLLFIYTRDMYMCLFFYNIFNFYYFFTL